MFFIHYISAELRRRRGRTLLTALGLAIGVGLVVVVSALSDGLDKAQDEVLKPLTGVGTDMSVARPLRVNDSGEAQSGGPGRLSATEQRALQRENGGGRFRLPSGNPGDHFEDDNLVSNSQLSFSDNQIARVAALDGVSDAAGSLTLNSIHVEGTVPEQGDVVGGPGAGGPPRNIDLKNLSVTGIDTSKPDLAQVTPGQVISGRYFSGSGHREAVLTESYARRENISLGDRVSVGGKKFRVVGVAEAPLGGQASDVYVKLGELQRISDREGRVNSIQVRAIDSGSVSSVAKAIESSFSGSQVTTAADLANRVGGSLDDAQSLASSLGTALVVLGLGAAFLIASLLTLSSVNKRTRELGTLKALGWPQRLVVRQVAGESLAQGALGGALGALLGVAGAAIVTLIGPTLEATVSGAAQAAGPGPGGSGPFGQGQVTSGATNVALDAPVDPKLILIAVGLALLGGLIAGAVGGLRAARLRPAEALRSVE